MPAAVPLVKKLRPFAAGGAGGLLLVALLFGGCKGDDLTGTITNKDGKPVSWGTVTAVGPDNRVYTAPIQPDGSYRLTGLPKGAEVRITVSSPNPTPVAVAAGPAGGAADGAKGKAAKVDGRRSYGVDPTTPQPNVPPPRNVPAPGQWYPIDGKYANPATSGLNATSGAGRHDITVDAAP